MGDRSNKQRAFVRGGVAMSNAPGVAFEYSNFAYALLGQIISSVTGQPYQRVITRETLEPLGMKDTRWEFNDVPRRNSRSDTAGKITSGGSNQCCTPNCRVP